MALTFQDLKDKDQLAYLKSEVFQILKEQLDFNEINGFNIKDYESTVSGADLTLTFKDPSDVTIVSVTIFNYQTDEFTMTINYQYPTDIALTNSTVPHLDTVGDNVGTLSANSVYTNTTLTYTLVSGTGDTNNADFTIVGDQLNLATQPNYYIDPSLSIRVRVTDSFGGTYEEVFTITVSAPFEFGNSIIFDDSYTQIMEFGTRTDINTAVQSAFTMFFKVKIRPYAGGNIPVIISSLDHTDLAAGGIEFRYDITAGAFTVSISEDAISDRISLVTSGVYSTSRWYDIVITCDGTYTGTDSGVKMYVDGAQATFASNNNLGTVTTVGVAKTFKISKRDNDTVYDSGIIIHEFALYDKELSSLEVAELWDTTGSEGSVHDISTSSFHSTNEISHVRMGNGPSDAYPNIKDLTTSDNVVMTNMDSDDIIIHSPFSRGTLNFDGVNKYGSLSLADSNSIANLQIDEEWTLVMRVNVDSLPATGIMFGKVDSTDYKGYWLVIDKQTSTTFKWNFSCATDWFANEKFSVESSTTYSINTSGQKHVCITNDGLQTTSSIKLIVGDIDVSRIVYTGGVTHPTDIENLTEPLYIARRSDGFYCDARMESFAIFDKKLSASEQTEIYNGNRDFDWRTSSVAVNMPFYLPVNPTEVYPNAVDAVGNKNLVLSNMSQSDITKEGI